MASAYAFSREHALSEWTEERSGWGGNTAVAKRDESVGLVARGRELAHIDEFLWQARRGNGGALALRGEPGVGKSALIEAAVARASEFRIVQIRGNTATDGVVVPPAQWPQPLAELARRFDVAAQLHHPRLALAQGADDVPAPPKATVVDAITGVLRRIVDLTSSPVLVTVDDCHTLPVWFVDAMAHSVLAHLSDRPLSLVLAWSETPHLTPFGLQRANLPQHRLGGLDVAQAMRLLSWHFDVLPTERVLSELVAGTGGNPLALLDVTGRLTAEQLEGWEALPDPLPVGDAVVRAFDVARHLPPAAQRALAVAAVARVPRDVLLAVLNELGNDFDDLGPAIDAGIVVDRGRRVDFLQPLVRAASFHRAPVAARRAARRALSTELARRDAIEPSAFHAAAEADAPDEGVTRRLAEAARVALDRGDPEAAARHEETAARFAVTGDSVAQHLVAAATLWMTVGHLRRAELCLERAAGLDVTDATGGELDYQLARLAGSADEGEVADRMVAASDRCLAEAPHRALAMLIDAAARKILADQPEAGESIAERAARLAGTHSSHAEVLASAVRSAAQLRAGRPLQDMADRSRVSLLIGQTERYTSSPEVALVVGRCLQDQDMRRQADRWSQWIGRCAERCGDLALAAVPHLLRAHTDLEDGHVRDAGQSVARAAHLAEQGCSPGLAAWSWSLTTRVHAVTGDYEAGFRDCARLFAAADRVGRSARVRAMPALALLELEQGRVGPALAWVRTAEEDLADGRIDGGWRGPMAVLADVVPDLMTVTVLSRSSEGVARWATLVEETGTALGSWHAWARAAGTDDATEAVQLFAEASDVYAAAPLARARLDLCRAVRLVDAGRLEEARNVLETLQRQCLDMGANGLAALTAKELDRMPPLRLPARTNPWPAGEPHAEQLAPAVVHGWEISLLGDFSVRYRGKPAHLPSSLATQAIKIVGIESRISVDELVELLWEGAEPGIGARRLRNVLWRIRSACGELLVREGHFVRLADDAVTDLSRFRELAAQALAHGVPREQGVRAARLALEHHRGELLPGDRYADWVASAREAVARTHVRLLDLLVDDALADGRTSEALTLLDRLAEVDPYDERHHIQMAEVHLQAGNRRRALDALERAERVLDDLGLAPSPVIRRLRDSLTF